MNSNIKPKLDFDPTDNYQKAKKDLITALDSVGKLPFEQQKSLAIELLGAKAVNDFIRFLQSYKKL